jgi:hypothetical protein
MAKKKDGVADGWILFKGWCERNGGTPIRGGSSADHVCFLGPLPDDTIDPGDAGTVDIAIPGSGLMPKFGEEMLALEIRASKLRLDKAQLELDIAKNRMSRSESKTKEK